MSSLRRNGLNCHALVNNKFQLWTAEGYRSILKHNKLVHYIREKPKKH